jgi:serine/threonine protein kinase
MMNANVKRAEHKGPHLSAPELRVLLFDDESQDGFRQAADHLEQCADCQSALTELAGDVDSWSETRSLLEGEGEPRWQPDLSASHVSASGPAFDRSSVEDHVLKLLGTPNHPEMLGRLGRYDIDKIIGSGGMGIVLKAHDSELNRPIAIKLLAPHLSHVGAARERFAREGRAAAAVVHEHVVAIYNVEADGALPFLIMQYVPGRSLQARVDDDGPLGVEEILRIGLQAAAGLSAAHAQGLVHRDVKPSNILLEDTVERAVLTDFGLARAMDDASLTQTGILAGTPHYMSPEQATGVEIDARSDLFSLGAVLYFMASGHPPFRAGGALAVLHRICQEKHRPVWQWNNEIPDELSEIIDRLLEKKPGRRFASAEEVRQQLAQVLSHVQQHGVSLRRVTRWRRWRRHLKALAVIGIVATLAVAATGTWYWATYRAANTANEATSPVTMDAVGKFFSSEKEYHTNLDEIHKSLSGASRESFYLHGDDTWRHSMEQIEHDLNHLESTDR